MMIAAGLGDPAAFRPEKTGALGRTWFRCRAGVLPGNAGSVLLEWHTETRSTRTGRTS